ncbi:unnamed protein product [Rhizophagus irregularis]|uniref:RRM domain-containing protein n=1 Tax=Rhizophagus irregularis TaxID=588596 RepID=A0A2I1FYZ6_9GLOM|nr:hypothetical protein RhiirA4_393657 [Rhizophagus irregularis]CAB4424106.1 unnamed protein product [Rhizophagus irregularis]
MSSFFENSCSGCGKDNHSVFFCGNIHHLGIKEIETWLKSINSPPFVHVIKKDQQGYGVVHFNTYEDACVFLHTMKGKRFSGPAYTIIKFSEAKEFKTKKLIKYDEIVTPSTSVITPSAIISDNSPITSDDSSTLTIHPPNDCQVSPMQIDLTNDNDEQSSSIPLIDTAAEGSVKKEMINLGCIGCMKLTTQVEFLKTKIISLQDELLLAQKEIIGYKSGLNDNVNKE